MGAFLWLTAAFRRYYTAKMNLDGRTGITLKDNWSHNFETRAHIVSNHIEIITYTGRRIGFDENGGNRDPGEPQNIPYQLVEQGNVNTDTDTDTDEFIADTDPNDPDDFSASRTSSGSRRRTSSGIPHPFGRTPYATQIC